MPSRVSNNLLSSYIVSLLLSLLSLTYAHTIDQVYMELSPEKNEFKALVFIDAGYCLPEYRGDKNQDAPDRDWLHGLSKRDHARLRQEAEKYMQSALQFMQDEAPVTYEVFFPDYASSPYDFYESLVQSPILRVELRGRYLPSGGSLQASWNDPYEANLLVELIWQDGEERMGNLLTIEPDSAIDLGVQILPFKVQEGGQNNEPVITAKKGGWWSFVKIGFDHIIPLGRDHIAFVIGLFLFSPTWRPLLHQTLTFTVAHSITLALTLLGVLAFSAQWVEVIIALSIVYVAVENLWAKEMGKRRLILVFLFGLLHGLGFGSVLGEYPLPKDKLMFGITGFNVGVELGQVVVLAICFLTIGWFKKSFKWIRIVGSLIIGSVGLYWVIQRILG